MPEEAWLTVNDIATRLRVSQHTVRRWLRQGELVGVKLGDRTGYRVRDEELTRFLARRTSVANPATDPDTAQ
jgi:excisionase family DNA binding protein